MLKLMGLVEVCICGKHPIVYGGHINPLELPDLNIKYLSFEDLLRPTPNPKIDIKRNKKLEDVIIV